jgi:hypothetical protein
VVLRYEQILHTLQTAVDDGEKKYTAELNATMGRGSKSAGDLIKIIFADFMPALLQVFHLSRPGRHGRTSCRRHNARLWLNQLSRDAHPTPQPGWCSGRYRAKEIPP